jgi:hypothetical protein
VLALQRFASAQHEGLYVKRFATSTANQATVPLHSQVLERALRQASSQFNSDASNPSLGFVRLSGALHCDERSAFQEIAHQLCRCVELWLCTTKEPHLVHTLELTLGSPSVHNQKPFTHVVGCSMRPLLLHTAAVERIDRRFAADATVVQVQTSVAPCSWVCI